MNLRRTHVSYHVLNQMLPVSAQYACFRYTFLPSHQPHVGCTDLGLPVNILHNLFCTGVVVRLQSEQWQQLIISVLRILNAAIAVNKRIIALAYIREAHNFLKNLKSKM